MFQNAQNAHIKKVKRSDKKYKLGEIDKNYKRKLFHIRSQCCNIAHAQILENEGGNQFLVFKHQIYFRQRILLIS